MKICIYGAGAIGAYLGLHLAEAGYGVTLIARGPHLEAMKTNGLRLRIDGAERIIHPTCTDDPAEAGPQDYVIVTLKAHQACEVAGRMAPLLGPEYHAGTQIAPQARAGPLHSRCAPRGGNR